MEQLAARKAHNLEVPGSSPGPATDKVKARLSGFYFIILPDSNRKGVGKTFVFPWRKPACRRQVLKPNGFKERSDVRFRVLRQIDKTPKVGRFVLFD